jgi:hypothetical protein
MTKHSQTKSHHKVRSIKSKRDFEGASAVVKQLAKEKKKDAAAEVRMQLLLKELDKFDPPEDDADESFSADDDFSGQGRRWSDASSERE